MALSARPYHPRRVAELIEDLRRVHQVADVFGVPSTAQSVRAVALRALEYDDEDVRALPGAPRGVSPGVRRVPLARLITATRQPSG
jgi:hypothetical protein